MMIQPTSDIIVRLCTAIARYYDDETQSAVMQEAFCRAWVSAGEARNDPNPQLEDMKVRRRWVVVASVNAATGYLMENSHLLDPDPDLEIAVPAIEMIVAAYMQDEKGLAAAEQRLADELLRKERGEALIRQALPGYGLH